MAIGIAIVIDFAFVGDLGCGLTSFSSPRG